MLGLQADLYVPASHLFRCVPRIGTNPQGLNLIVYWRAIAKRIGTNPQGLRQLG